MARIWLNHWFSTAYNIIELIKKGDSSHYIIGTNANEYAVYGAVCDEFYKEPVLKDDEYVEFCLEFCRDHKIDVFMPRRGMLPVSMNKKRFEAIGVKVMVDDYDKISILNILIVFQHRLFIKFIADCSVYRMRIIICAYDIEIIIVFLYQLYDIISCTEPVVQPYPCHYFFFPLGYFVMSIFET